MKMYLFFVLLLGFGAVSGFAQKPSATPVPQPTPNLQAQGNDLRREQDDFNRLNKISRERGTIPGLFNENSRGYLIVSRLYHKTTKKELALLSPEAEDLKQYAGFLHLPNTGLIKLAADKDCFTDEYMVTANAECAAYTMPGAGNSYSFRAEDYRIPRLADLTYKKNSFTASGTLLHGFFVELGEMPLEQVTLQTKGLKFLTEFKPEPDFQKAGVISRNLSGGITTDGFVYRRTVAAKENTTYVLRSVAYRGKYYRAVDGVTYDEFELDKRKDIIVAFRVVRRDEDGAITILWKILSKHESPKIVWSKKDERGK